MNKDRKRKERMNKINEIERKRKRLKQKRTYQYETPDSVTEANCEPPCILIAPFPNKMRKHRALRNSLPKSPTMRVSTVVAYISNFKSPTVNTLKKSSIIKTPGESAEKSLGEAVIEDLKATVSATKLKCSDDARAAMNIISASVRLVAKLSRKFALNFHWLKHWVFLQDVLAQDFQSVRKYCTHNTHPTCIRKGKLDQMRYLTRTENLHMTSGALLKTLT